MPSKHETVNKTKTDRDDPGCSNIDQGCTCTSFHCIGNCHGTYGCMSFSKLKDILDRAFTLSEMIYLPFYPFLRLQFNIM